jgi:ATP synthase protein I
MNTDEEQKRLRQLGAYLTIPFVLAVPPILGGFIGNWLDHALETEPFLMLILIVLGFIAGFIELYRLIKRFGNGS